MKDIKNKKGSNDEIRKLDQRINELEEENSNKLKLLNDLANSEAAYKSLFNINPQPMWVYEVETMAFLAVNDSAISQYGHSRDEFLNMNIKQIRPEGDVPALIETVNQLPDGFSETGSWVHITRDGELIDVNIKSHTITFNGKKARLVLASNITESNKGEEALRESEERYRVLFEGAGDGILVHDFEGRILDCNQNYCDQLGFDRAELLQLNLRDLITQQNLELIPERSEQITSRGFQVFESEHIHKSGRIIPIETNSRLFQYKGSPAIIAIIRDISDRKKAEEEKAQLQAQLQQAHKMEAVGTLAGGIAHDFNNLLMGIQGRTSLLLLDTESQHPHFDQLKSIEGYIKSAANLTKQLLGFARGGKYEIKAVSFNELIRQQNAMFGRARKEITITEDLDKDLMSVEVDEVQIEQVILNLYVNAWQAMPSGGTLHTKTENAEISEEHAGKIDRSAGNYVKFTVTDNGSGMTPEVQERMFEPFFTTKKMGRGTGLGLASAYGIVNNHGGFFEVSSQVGTGSSFSVFLPASQKAVIKKPAPKNLPVKGTETVLLVDDEDMIIDVTMEMLQSHGYRVLTARSGQEAISVYLANRDDIDIVILDLIMPQLSGGETFDQLKGMDPNVKILLSSGYSLDGEASAILERGCDGFIQKPFDTMTLSSKIQEIIQK